MSTIELKEISVLRLQPGDTLVVRIDAALRAETRDAVTSELKQHVPEGVKVFVLGNGVELIVLRGDA